MGLERLVFVTKSVKRNGHIPWLRKGKWFLTISKKSVQYKNKVKALY